MRIASVICVLGLLGLAGKADAFVTETIATASLCVTTPVGAVICGTGVAITALYNANPTVSPALRYDTYVCCSSNDVCKVQNGWFFDTCSSVPFLWSNTLYSLPPTYSYDNVLRKGEDRFKEVKYSMNRIVQFNVEIDLVLNKNVKSSEIERFVKKSQEGGSDLLSYVMEPIVDTCFDKHIYTAPIQALSNNKSPIWNSLFKCIEREMLLEGVPYSYKRISITNKFI